MNRKDSEDLVRVGPGTVDGQVDAAVLDAGGDVVGAEGRRRADAADAARRAADRVPRQRRPGRRDGPQMPASLRLAVSRAQRGERAALRLSRLEVRRRRQLRRYAERPPAAPTSSTGSRPRPTRRSSATASSGSIWASAQRRRRCRRSRRRCCPRARSTIDFVQRECNWLQALEGEIDTSHFGFLHAGCVDPDDVAEDNLLRYTVTNRAPDYHVADTDWRHDVRRLPPGRVRARPIGASPISCFRSGRRRRRASSPSTCTTAPGSRWTITTRCSSAWCGAGIRRRRPRQAMAS